MEIRPILSSLLRNKTAPLLIAAQVALTLAIICNALYIIRDRLAAAARPSGTDEASLFTVKEAIALLPQEHPVRSYIANQEKHHRHKTFREELVELLTQAAVEFDERYLD